MSPLRRTAKATLVQQVQFALVALFGFDAMNAITLSLWRRPQYALRVVDSLRKCHGIGDYQLFVNVDGGGPPEMKQIADSIDFAPCQTTIQSQHLGCNQMTRIALDQGFEYSDYAIHIEEDTIVAPDTLQYFEWGRGFGNNPAIFTVNAWRHDRGWLPENGGEMFVDEEGLASTLPFFNCWVWATWRDRYQEMVAGWTTGTDSTRSWDYAVSDVRRNRLGVQPLTSRAMNIGDKDGIHRGGHFLSFWAGSPTFFKPRHFLLI